MRSMPLGINAPRDQCPMGSMHGSKAMYVGSMPLGSIPQGSMPLGSNSWDESPWDQTPYSDQCPIGSKPL